MIGIKASDKVIRQKRMSDRRSKVSVADNAFQHAAAEFNRRRWLPGERAQPSERERERERESSGRTTS
jgi:hypothetical protein